jgi:FAD/FMN-containing dehydrogenase
MRRSSRPVRALRAASKSLRSLLRRDDGPAKEPFIPAHARRLPLVHATVRVTRTTWRNWARTLEATPARLYSDHAGGPWRSPRTLDDLVGIVRDARRLGATVRVFGSSHSWAHLVPTDGFLVDNRMIGADGDRYVTRIDPGDPEAGRAARATVPPGITSRELELWLWESGYTLPASSVEDCFTVGGMVVTATHGAGMDLPGLSDHVVGMTFVDGLGQIRRWTRESATEDELDALRTNLGVFGLIHDVTLEVVPRYEVHFTMETVPYADLFADTDEARARLRRLHEENLSVEVFWWPFVFEGAPFVSRPALNPNVWLLTAKKHIAPDVPERSALRRFVHMQLLDIPTMALNGWFQRAITASPFVGFLPWVLCATNLWVGARGGSFRMPAYDAIHYVNATGVEFVLVTACEWSIPFRPAAADDEPDGYERVRASFAALHDLVDRAFRDHAFTDPRSGPVNVAIEMRTMAPSRALLSPQWLPEAERAHTRFAVPELVTSAHQPAWPEFLRRAHLAMVGDPARFGDDVRCHLAKEWRDLPHPRHPEDGMAGFQRAHAKAAGTWQRFQKVREALDPDGVFLNDFLRSWFEVPPHEARGERRGVDDRATAAPAGAEVG